MLRRDSQPARRGARQQRSVKACSSSLMDASRTNVHLLRVPVSLGGLASDGFPAGNKNGSALFPSPARVEVRWINAASSGSSPTALGKTSRSRPRKDRVGHALPPGGSLVIELPAYYAQMRSPERRVITSQQWNSQRKAESRQAASIAAKSDCIKKVFFLPKDEVRFCSTPYMGACPGYYRKLQVSQRRTIPIVRSVVNSSMAQSPLNRPRPEFRSPPKATWASSCTGISLMCIIPDLIPRLKRTPRSRS